jgi:hypothetical protein
MGLLRHHARTGAETVEFLVSAQGLWAVGAVLVSALLDYWNPSWFATFKKDALGIDTLITPGRILLFSAVAFLWVDHRRFVELEDKGKSDRDELKKIRNSTPHLVIRQLLITPQQFRNRSGQLLGSAPVAHILISNMPTAPLCHATAEVNAYITFTGDDGMPRTFQSRWRDTPEPQGPFDPTPARKIGVGETADLDVALRWDGRWFAITNRSEPNDYRPAGHEIPADLVVVVAIHLVGASVDDTWRFTLRTYDTAHLDVQSTTPVFTLLSGPLLPNADTEARETPRAS